jgi:Tetratricopeptide repeat
MTSKMLWSSAQFRILRVAARLGLTLIILSMCAVCLAQVPDEFKPQAVSEEALRDAPTKVYGSAGARFADQGNLKCALALFEEVVRLEPYSAQAHYNLGVVHERAKQLPEAAAEFRLALQTCNDGRALPCRRRIADQPDQQSFVYDERIAECYSHIDRDCGAGGRRSRQCGTAHHHTESRPLQRARVLSWFLPPIRRALHARTRPKEVWAPHPPVQGPRVQSMATEVAAGAVGTATATSLTWPLLKPGTYLLESGTHPSIQVPMGLMGMLVVTTAPSGTAAGTACPAPATTTTAASQAAVPAGGTTANSHSSSVKSTRCRTTQSTPPSIRPVSARRGCGPVCRPTRRVIRAAATRGRALLITPAIRGRLITRRSITSSTAWLSARTTRRLPCSRLSSLPFTCIA